MLDYGECITGINGRKVTRSAKEEIKEKLEAQYKKGTNQKIYSRRKMRVELPFGHIKRNLKTDAFLLRGKRGVDAETSLLATCFNMARMISIFGVTELLQRLAS